MATASPPGSGFVSAARMRISRWAMEPRVITLPHRMNSGIDRITSLSSADPHVLDDVLEVAAAPEQVHAGGDRRAG